MFRSSDGGENFAMNTLVGREPSTSTGLVYYSQDGSHIMLARTCNIWRSVNSGASFSRLYDGGTDRACFRDVASSRNGEVIVAVASGSNGYGRKDGIFVSTDGGDNWVAHEASVNFEPVHGWYSVAMSDDGNQIIAVANDGVISISQDSGVTWTTTPLAAPVGGWNSVTMANDLQHVVIADGDRLYKWSSLTNALTPIGVSGYWLKVVSSAGGDVLVGLQDAYDPVLDTTVRQLWLSTNAGANWVQVVDSQNSYYYDFALSRDGSKLVGSASGTIFNLSVSPIDFSSTEQSTPVVAVPSQLSSLGNVRISRFKSNIRCEAPAYSYSSHGGGSSVEIPTSYSWSIFNGSKVIETSTTTLPEVEFQSPMNLKGSQIFCQVNARYLDASTLTSSHNSSFERFVSANLRDEMNRIRSSYWEERSDANSKRAHDLLTESRDANWKIQFKKISDQWRNACLLTLSKRKNLESQAAKRATLALEDAGIALTF